jgi:hypothetical protein
VAIRIQEGSGKARKAAPKRPFRGLRPTASKPASTKPSARRSRGGRQAFPVTTRCCARCGNVFTETILSLSQCKRCGADLRSCAQCESFDTGQRFECAQTIPARISPKDARNTCELFSPRVTVERDTHSQTQRDAPNSAKKAFDDLFK